MASLSSHKSNYALAISYIVQELIRSYDAGETLNLTRLKGEAAKKFKLQGIPKMSDILHGLPIAYRSKLWPYLKTKPVRTASVRMNQHVVKFKMCLRSVSLYHFSAFLFPGSRHCSNHE